MKWGPDSITDTLAKAVHGWMTNMFFVGWVKERQRHGPTMYQPDIITQWDNVQEEYVVGQRRCRSLTHPTKNGNNTLPRKPTPNRTLPIVAASPATTRPVEVSETKTTDPRGFQATLTTVARVMMIANENKTKSLVVPTEYVGVHGVTSFRFPLSLIGYFFVENMYDLTGIDVAILSFGRRIRRLRT